MRLDKLTCAYCNRRAHRTEWEGDAQVPVCKDHASRHGEVDSAVPSQPLASSHEQVGPDKS